MKRTESSSSVEELKQSLECMSKMRRQLVMEDSLKVKRISLRVLGLTRSRTLSQLLSLLMLRREVLCTSKAVATPMLMESSQETRSLSLSSSKTDS